nr:hypothetical protein [Neobacillus sp. Marseille-Q6967]
MTLTPQSCISMVPIQIRKDRKNYIIEDELSGEFYEMPEVCIDAIHFINQGKQLGDIEKTLKQKYPAEEVDLLDFTQQLLELGLVQEIDGIKIERNQRENSKLGSYWISSNVGKFFFNKFSFALYSILFVINLILFIINPDLLPHHEDIFVFDVMALNVLLWMTFTFTLVLIHELGHVLAMRAHNLPTKVEIGHRLFIVVLETDMSSVWKLSPKERNGLFLSGLCFDTVILFIALGLHIIFPEAPKLAVGLMNLAVFDIFLRMLYQCCFYLKTDLYYVFENITGCYNVMEVAKQLIVKRLPFIQSDSREETIFNEEKKTVFLYSIFYFLGIVITIALFFVFYIPEIIDAANQLLPGFRQSPTSLAFWDAVLFSLQIGIFILLLLYSWRKKYLKI